MDKKKVFWTVATLTMGGICVYTACHRHRYPLLVGFVTGLALWGAVQAYRQ